MGKLAAKYGHSLKHMVALHHLITKSAALTLPRLSGLNRSVGISAMHSRCCKTCATSLQRCFWEVTTMNTLVRWRCLKSGRRLGGSRRRMPAGVSSTTRGTPLPPMRCWSGTRYRLCCRRYSRPTGGQNSSAGSTGNWTLSKNISALHEALPGC
jgi:hypothetical protein